MKRAATWVACAAWAMTTLDAAQVRLVRHGDDRLSGITALDIVVNALNPEAALCGVSRAALQEAAVVTLRTTGLEASVSGKASSGFYTAYLTAQSSSAADRCVTSLSAELMARVDGIPEADRYLEKDAWGSLLVGQMPLLRQTGLVSSSHAAHAGQVEAAVREHFTTIGARIRAVNPVEAPQQQGFLALKNRGR